MAAHTLVPLEDYLKTGYHPDVEYIDGELKEKPLVQWTHANLQVFISSYFHQRRKEWRIVVGVEARTQVTPTRVRLPDVVVDRPGRHPETLTSPPLIAIEILSPSNALPDVLDRMQDLMAMGVRNAWVIDPEARTGLVCSPDGSPQTVTRFEVAGTPIYLDLPELFAAFDEDNAG